MMPISVCNRLLAALGTLAVLIGPVVRPLSAAEPVPLLSLANFPAAAVSSAGGPFLHLQVGKPGKMVILYAEIPVTGGQAFKFDYRLRYTDVHPGAQPWFDARIILGFKDAKGKAVAPAPAPPYFTGSSSGWTSGSEKFLVPAQAVVLTVMPAMFNAQSGSMDIRSLSLTPIAAAEVPAPGAPAAVAPPVVADGGGKAPSPLHVDGLRILDAAGHEVWLQGVNVPSLGWSVTGDGVAVPSVVSAIGTWKANIIRLPVLAALWLGKDRNQHDGGASYRGLVRQAVLAATSRGAYVDLDLHEFRAPDDQDKAFWIAAATAFKDNPAVLFGLFNEPHDIDWKLWRDGGDITDTQRKKGVVAENNLKITTVHSPGMQGLIDAVRSTGAHNIVIVGGLDWAYDLSGVLHGFALKDHDGDGLIYDTHVYPWKSDWQGKFLDAAAKYPLIVGEVGCDIRRYDWVPPERFENPYTWAPDMIACIQAHHLNWTAWSFHPGASPCVIQDLKDFTPTPYWGSFVRAALLGARFQSTKLR